MKAVGNDKIQLRGKRIVPRQQGDNRNYAQAVSGQGQGKGGGHGGSRPGGNTRNGQGICGSRTTHPYVHCRSWNVRGWNKDVESDNFLVRNGCLDVFNLDIVAVVETHLRDKDDLLFNYFQWYGHNRTDIHRKARKSSGGVGFKIRKSLLSSFKCIQLDDSGEGILWLKLSAYECDFTMCICAMYLPPEGTTHYVNPNAFYVALLSQILTYQDECDLFYLCGDINGCCWGSARLYRGCGSYT